MFWLKCEGCDNQTEGGIYRVWFLYTFIYYILIYMLLYFSIKLLIYINIQAFIVLFAKDNIVFHSYTVASGEARV